MTRQRLEIEIETQRGSDARILVHPGGSGVSANARTLTISEQGVSVQGAEGTTALGMGAWADLGGVRLRVKLPEPEPTIAENSGWSPPEIVATVQGDDGKPVVRRRALPTEEGETIVVGRGTGGPDLFSVEDRHVSRKHLTITRRGLTYVVTDHKSRWGTTKNGSPLVGSAELRHGDELKVGDAVIRFSSVVDLFARLGAMPADEASKEPPAPTPIKLTPDETLPERSRPGRWAIVGIVAGAVLVVVVLLAALFADRWLVLVKGGIG